jgi:uncharacterized phiE125 gp8 family phage protein
MRYSVITSAEPAAEPLSLAETKTHLRVDDDITDQDDLIAGLIGGAREWCENYTRRSFVRRTLQLRMDAFPCEFRLPYGPVSSVQSVEYIDSGGATAILAADQYQVDTQSAPARIVPVFGVVWPTVKHGAVNGVVVNYVAGYAPGDGSPTNHAANVPKSIKAAMLLLIAHLYENRELVDARQMHEVPFGVKTLLAPFEIRDYTLE